MPHLDEGMLHTYLDDALPENVELHLRECAECRANLENARLLKQSADTILAAATPVDISMPSFEELQARARVQSGDRKETDSPQAGGQQRSFNQLRSLAWAATVVLAVAVGWYGRSTLLNTNPSRLASEDDSRGRLTISLPETEGTDSDASDVQTPTSLTGLEAGETAPSAELNELVGAQVNPDIVGGVAVAADRGETLEARRVSAPEPVEPSADVREETEVGATPLPTAQIVSSAAAAAGEARQEQRDVRSRPQVITQVAAERAAAEPTVNTGRGESAGIAWTSVDEATAGSILDGTVPKVDGLPVIGYAMSSLGGHQAVRVLQRLDSGQLLELVITPEGDAALAPEAKKGVALLDAAPIADAEFVNTVAVARGNLHIRLSAAVSMDSLRVIGQNVSTER